jgi:hypothetical protein
LAASDSTAGLIGYKGLVGRIIQNGLVDCNNLVGPISFSDISGLIDRISLVGPIGVSGVIGLVGQISLGISLSASVASSAKSASSTCQPRQNIGPLVSSASSALA